MTTYWIGWKRLTLPVVLFACVCVKAADGMSPKTAAGMTPQTAVANALRVNHPLDWRASLVALRVATSRRVKGTLRHHWEDCSGAIIDVDPVTVLTAWHCFDGYNDLSKPPMVKLNNHWHSGRLRQTGQGMHADWAIVTVAGAHGSPSLLADTSGNYLRLGGQIIIAGFAQGEQALPRKLLVRKHCTIDRIGSQWSSSRCDSQQGLSGGPVLVHDGSTMRIIGVISARRNDNELLFTSIAGVSTQIHD